MTTQDRPSGAAQPAGQAAGQAGVQPWQEAAMRAAMAACRDILGAAPARSQMPPLRQRSLRVELEDGRSVYASRRAERHAAVIEHRVLEALTEAGVAAPAVLGFNGEWLIQGRVEGPSLSQALDRAERNTDDEDGPGAGTRALLEAAVEALLAAREAVETAGLADALPMIGAEREQLAPLIEAPERLGRRLGVPAPVLRGLRLVRALRVESPRFVRWDNRCGNAIVQRDGSVVWVDWSHCARRHGLDDLMMLLADEFTPDRPAVEPALLQRYGEAMAPGLGLAEAGGYLALIGSLRSAHRVLAILELLGDRPWQSTEDCLARDLPGATPGHLRRLCARGARWAASAHLVEPLAPWFESLADRFAAEEGRLAEAAERAVNSDDAVADALAGVAGDPVARPVSPVAAPAEPAQVAAAPESNADSPSEAAAVDPALAQWLQSARQLARQGRYTEAAAAWREAIDNGADDAGSWFRLAVALHQAGQSEAAIRAYAAALERDAKSFDAWSNLGSLLRTSGMLEQAETAMRRALRLRPEEARVHTNLGNVLRDKGDLAGAEAAFRDALERAPEQIEALTGLGNALRMQGRLEEALAPLEQALALDPEGAARAHWNRALTLLPLGRFAEGWDEHEWRWRLPEYRRIAQAHDQPAWSGARLGGQRLLIWAEQGLGDQLMFGSVLPDVATLAGRGGADREGGVTVECDPRLIPLFARSFEPLRFAAEGQAGSDCDLQIAAGGLPRLFRRAEEDFPPRRGYLRTDPDRVAELGARLMRRARGKRLVGLSWRSEATKSGARRSLALADWLPVLRARGCRFVTLQYGAVDEELSALQAEHGIEILRDETLDPNDDLDGLAAEIAALDLTITVDNVTAHLAGALGAPTWVLLPEVPNWRWLVGRDDSPWYSSLRLFHQAEAGDWDPVIAEVAAALETLED